MNGPRTGAHAGIGFTVKAEEGDRFWRHVLKGDGCWEWTGKARRGNGGYGGFSLQRVRVGLIPAHRVAFAIAHGRICTGVLVMHTCDNPRCVRPDHLRAGSARENALDSVAKNRWRPSGRPRGRQAIRVIPPSTFTELVGLVTLRRATIFSRYFGLFGFAPVTLDAVGKALGVSRERVRQLIKHTQDILLDDSQFAAFWSALDRKAA